VLRIGQLSGVSSACTVRVVGVLAIPSGLQVIPSWCWSTVVFFDTELHPQVRFSSTHVGKPTDNQLSVAGELQVAGNEVALTLGPAIRQTGARLHVDTTTRGA
jgi:polyisoprenoid-binding protein YceI